MQLVWLPSDQVRMYEGDSLSELKAFLESGRLENLTLNMQTFKQVLVFTWK